MDANGKKTAMELSLDDYIKESGLYVSSMLKQSKISQQNINNDIRTGTNKFTDNSMENEDEDDILDITLEDKVFDSSFDLRDKIHNSTIQNQKSEKNNFLKANSPAWRLVPHNIAPQDRPAGIPPLISSELYKEQSYKLNVRRNIANDNFNAQPESLFQRTNNFPNNNNRGNRNQRRNNHNFNQYRNMPYNNNSRYNNNRHNNNNDHNGGRNGPRNNYLNNVPNICKMISGNTPQNLTIQATSLNGFARNSDVQKEVMQMQQPTLLKPQHSPIVYDPTPAELAIKNGLAMSSNVRGVSSDVIPAIASKLLEILGSAAIQQPKYDMKLQKEIHCLQKKPMIYRCPDGEIISSDGPGIRNVSLEPNSTGITLNQRFA